MCKNLLYVIVCYSYENKSWFERVNNLVNFTHVNINQYHTSHKNQSLQILKILKDRGVSVRKRSEIIWNTWKGVLFNTFKLH